MFDEIRRLISSFYIYYWLSFYMINQFLIKVHNIFPGINFVYASLRHFNPRSGGVKLAKI